MKNKPKLFSEKTNTNGSNSTLPTLYSQKYPSATSISSPIKIDLNEEILLNVYNKIKNNIKSKQPSNFITLWGGRRQVERQELNLQHQRLLLQQLDDLSLTIDQMTSIKAKMYLLPFTIQAIIDGHFANLKLARIEFLNKIHGLKEDIKKRQQDRVLEKHRAIAEIKSIQADTHIKQLQGNLLQKVIDELDLDNISPAQAFVLVKALNPNADANVDFASQQLMLDAQLEKMKAETAKKIHEARREGIQADQDNLAYIQTKKKYD